MFFISKKRFEHEVDLRVREEIERYEEHLWHEEVIQEIQELKNQFNVLKQALSVEIPVEENRIGF